MATCYFPNGQVAEDNYACDASADVSVCCGSGSVCLDNKVCLANNQETIRGACTDRTWTSPECPQWCTGESYRNMNRKRRECTRESRGFGEVEADDMR